MDREQTMKGLRYKIRQRWKWRGYKREDWPLKYVGPSLAFIEHGLPLRQEPGAKGAPGARRYSSPDGLIRLIHTNHIAER